MSKQLASLPVVFVTPLNLNKGKSSGIQYSDNEFILEADKRSEKINELFAQLENHINDNSSVLLYKEDVKRLADQLSGKSKTSKEIFDTIKQRLRANYHVLKLAFDPRTLQFNGIKTAFIVHKM
jgi:hypothetical protein